MHTGACVTDFALAPFNSRHAIICSEPLMRSQWLVTGNDQGVCFTVPLPELSVQAEKFDGIVSFDGFLGFVLGELPSHGRP